MIPQSTWHNLQLNTFSAGKKITSVRIRSFRNAVYRYFKRHGRDLPWRGTDNPYHIFVSEIMLQQTQVDRVVDKYQQFISAFPDFQLLAHAPLGEVLRVWKGLGYNRRAKMLKDAARVVAERHGGRLPDDPRELVRLPGIGPATAASIAAFAFDRPVVFIETNIRSVFIHHFFGDKEGVDDRQILPLVEQALDRQSPRRWYSAVMDYGVSLKKRVPNPSRRSRHYVRQSRFEDSDRQVRGKIIAALLEQGTATEKTLVRIVADAKNRVPALLRRLCDEKMVARAGRKFKIGS